MLVLVPLVKLHEYINLFKDKKTLFLELFIGISFWLLFLFFCHF